jgi:large subunit ribosomal protein L20
MPRVTKALAAKAKHKKVLKATKGHYGARSRLFKTAKQSNVKALQYAFRDRRNKKRTFRSLWISRISAALLPLEFSYSRFINKLSKANIKLDRKSLAGIAFSDPDTFKKIVEKVRV